jgi:hypothetical protein
VQAPMRLHQPRQPENGHAGYWFVTGRNGWSQEVQRDRNPGGAGL